MLTQSQKENILDLFIRVKKDKPQFLHSWTERLFTELLNSQTTYVLCFESDLGKVVSALVFTGQPEAQKTDGKYSPSEIQLIFTDPSRLKQGHARRLIQKLKEGSNEVWLDVHPLNLAALGLYQSEGFKEVGRRKSYYFDGSEAILMSYQK